MSKRLNIALPERSVERLEALKERTDASSVTEVIKHALMTYESIADHLSEGVTFSGRYPNGETFAVQFLIDVPKKSPQLKVVGE
ncbi:ribbon-helix-helix protein, CopG family [Salipiger pacificus]|nr:ribbon-helix-helix protein, CopG family [Alloyangia pacifica]